VLLASQKKTVTEISRHVISTTKCMRPILHGLVKTSFVAEFGTVGGILSLQSEELVVAHEPDGMLVCVPSLSKTLMTPEVGHFQVPALPTYHPL